MTNTHSCFELAYVSTLAPDAPISVVGDILRQSRTYNALHQLTGLIVFDGMRFAQLLEGSEQHVRELIARIAQDTRHVEMRTFHSGSMIIRRFSKFALGFADVEKSDLESLDHLEGPDAIDYFMNMVPTLDLGA